MSETSTTFGPRFGWRLAQPDDAPAITRIYNESVAGGGHSPVLLPMESGSLKELVQESRRQRWPLWVLLAAGEVVAWSQVKPIAWGTEACHQAGELSVYIDRDWQGRGAAGEVLLRVYGEIRRFGFTSVSCWILASNHKSLLLARASRLKLWGCLPQVANYGGLLEDVQIWGARLDDAEWCQHLERVLARAERRRRGAQQPTLPALASLAVVDSAATTPA
jgi:phosphinothricin acetyltransferase